MIRRKVPATPISPHERCQRSRCTRRGFEWPDTPMRLCVADREKLGKSRYGVKRVEGVLRSYPSASHAERDGVLTLAETAGAIRNLEREVKFEHRCNGTLIEAYYADFVYDELVRGEWVGVVEDSKNGLYTKDYLRKKRWMLAEHGIRIHESGERWHRGGSPKKRRSKASSASFRSAR